MFSSRLRRAGRGRFGPRLRLQFLEERVTPTTFVVSNLLDGPVSKAGDLPGSLRQAIFDANANPGADVVDATGVSGTIVLAAGTLQLSDQVSIVGPSANALTIDGNQSYRVIFIGTKNYLGDFSISGLTLTKGYGYSGGAIDVDAYQEGSLTLSNMKLVQNATTAMQGEGGAIYARLPNVTVNDSLISQNYSGGGGGGITASRLTMNNSTVSFNQANNGFGGGLFTTWLTLNSCVINDNSVGGNIYGQGGGVSAARSLVVDKTLIFNNTSKLRDGGGIFVGTTGSSVQITNSTLAGNKAQGGSSSGGAIFGNVADLTIWNSTISGNSATKYGGGISLPFANASTNLNIRNSTIVANEASTGSGIYSGETSSVINLESSIVADNPNSIFPQDISSPGTVNAINCNITDMSGIYQFNRSGTFVSASPQLLPLMFNGGPTPTRMPGPNSPVRNAGSNASGLVTDQRGLPRQVGSSVDIGAVETDYAGPTATVISADVVTAGATSYEFTVRFDGTAALNPATIINNHKAVRVAGPGDFDVPAQFVNVSDVNPGVPVTATYQIAAPGGSFDYRDLGTYTIAIQPNQVADINGSAVAGGERSSFQVLIPANIVVTNFDDGPVTKAGDLPGSLRQAIFDANAAPTIDTITFDAQVFDVVRTIYLSAGSLAITDNLTIAGQGKVILDGGLLDRGISINLEQTFNPKTATISGLTIENGRAATGGGIHSVGAALELQNCIVTGNVATAGSVNGGGGIYGLNGSLTLDNCVVSYNQSESGLGGGIQLLDFTALTIRNCQISMNVAYLSGGGIHATQSSTYKTAGVGLIENSLITDNQSRAAAFVNSGGGGLFFRGSYYDGKVQVPGTLTVRDCIIDANSTTSAGGGAFIGYADNFVLTRTGISGNSAGTNGGGLYLYAHNGVLLESSTISGNTATGSLNNPWPARGGGGVYFWGTPPSFGFRIANCTISNNHTNAFGGGVQLYSANGLFEITNSTVVDNTAIGGGGGVYLSQASGIATLNVNSSIIARNIHATAPDLSVSGVVNAQNSLIGVGTSKLNASNSFVGTLAQPLDPRLGPLADNGGPTKTHALLPGSLAINHGSNPYWLAYDQRGPGFPRDNSAIPDIGAFEFTMPPRAIIVVGDATAQRSMIRTMTVLFDQPVEFPYGLSAAFELQRHGQNGPTGLVSLGFHHVSNVVTLTFVDPLFAPNPANSLIDGKYTVTLIGSKILGAGGALDGNSDTIPGDDQSLSFHRLFGDSDGDGRVSAVDYNAFRQVWMAASLTFDFNNDGMVGATDFRDFGSRYGVMI